MKNQWVKDLCPGMNLDSLFLVAEKELRPFKDASKGFFLQLKLADLTGDIRAKCWERAEECSRKFRKGDVVAVKGVVKEFEGEPQIEFNIYNVRKCAVEEFDASHFLPKTKKNVDVLRAELEGIVAGFKNRFLRELLSLFFADEAFMKNFLKAPGGKVHHHAFLGGLIEHTHSVVMICKRVCEVYSELDEELLLAGAILHDIGKIRDYTYHAVIDVSDEGGLVGHIVLGNELLQEKIALIPDFPQELAWRLKHFIVSHHGTEEWGSPIKPRFKEACALAFADLLDAHLSEFLELQKEEEKKGVVSGNHWSTFVRELERFLYLGKQEESGGERD